MKISSVLILFAIHTSVHCDDYLKEIQNKCTISKSIHHCLKYRLLKYMKKINPFDDHVKLIKISTNYTIPKESYRQLSDDSEMTKFWKFIGRQTDLFAINHGLVFNLPEGVELIEDEGRSKKKRRDMMIPLLMVFKLFKLNVLSSLILAGVVIIKKAIIAAAIALPWVVSSLKNLCKQQQYHIVPYRMNEEHHIHDHEHVDGGNGFGYSDIGDDGRWDRAKIKQHAYGYK